MRSSPPSGRRSRKILVPAAFLFVLCLAGIIALYVRQGRIFPPTVTIQNPESGTLAEINQVLPVGLSAYYDKGVIRLELYADGALVGSQDSDLSEGSNPLLMNVPWMPLTTGAHVLMARAYDREQGFYDSNVVLINVVDRLSDTATLNTSSIELGPEASLPSLYGIANVSGASLDDLRSLNPGLADYPPTAPLPEDTTLTVPYAPEPAPENPPAAPAPLPGSPGIPQITSVSAPDCTTIQLSWQDVPDETGYTLYRMGSGEAGFTPVAHLEANTASYSDTIPHFGNYIYQVGADKGSLESLSNVTPAATADSCEPPAPSGTTNLTVSFLTLRTTQAFDGIYCYSSIAGSPFRRIPLHDFQVLAPEADGLTYNLQTQLATFGQVMLASHPISSPFDLTLECWGRRGAESTSLGAILSSRGSSEWDGRELTEEAGAVLLRYRIDQNPISTHRVIAALTPLIPAPQLDLPAVFMPLDGGSAPILPPPTNVRDIRPFNTICRIMSLFNTQPSFCQGANTWQVGDGIAWDWSDPTGLYSTDDLFGYHVKITQLDMIDPHHLTLTTLGEYSTHPGRLMSTPIPGILNNIRCSTRVLVYVQAVADFGTSDYSDPAIFDAPPCVLDNQITITVERITVGSGNPDSVTDNDPCVFCTDRRLELYGSLQIGRFGGITSTGPTAHNGPEFGECPAQTECARGGIYEIGTSNSLGWNILMTGDAPGPGQTLSFLVALYDYDYFTYLTSYYPGAPPPHFPNSADAYRWCYGFATVPGRSALEWARFDQTVHLRDSGREAACDIQVHIQGGIHLEP